MVHYKGKIYTPRRGPVLLTAWGATTWYITRGRSIHHAGGLCFSLHGEQQHGTLQGEDLYTTQGACASHCMGSNNMVHYKGKIYTPRRGPVLLTAWGATTWYITRGRSIHHAGGLCFSLHGEQQHGTLQGEDLNTTPGACASHCMGSNNTVHYKGKI